jgi:hypothetical protein
MNKHLFRYLIVVAAILTLTLAARADSRYVWCSGSTPGTNKVFFSNIFASDQGLQVGQFQNDFTAYVSAHYKANIVASCTSYYDQTSAQKGLDSNLQLLANQSEMTVVRTGWYEGLR